MDEFNKVLSIDRKSREINQRANLVKESLVQLSATWKGGLSLDDKRYYEIWNNEKYSVRFGKPGKEFYKHDLKHKDGFQTNNKNDMFPAIFENDKLKDVPGTFDSIFHEFRNVMEKDLESFKLLGSLIYRNAFLLDHCLKEGLWKYVPPCDVVQYVQKKTGNIYDVDVECFLHYINAISWNEDVKYWTLGHDLRAGIGRRNNLLTYLNIMGLLMNKIDLMKLCASFARPPSGVAPITQKDAKLIFPYLCQNASSK